jgi:molecular chaperone DnaJ
LLGIEVNATEDDIRRAYKKIAIKYHPDKTSGNAALEEEFKKYTDAYQTLLDPVKRKEYDNRDTFANNFQFYGECFNGEGYKPKFGGAQSFDRDQMKPEAPRGDDITLEVDYKLEEFWKGVEKSIKVSRMVHCRLCAGTGAKSLMPCPECNRLGFLKVPNPNTGDYDIIRCRTCHGSRVVTKVKCSHCDGSGINLEDQRVKVNIPVATAPGSVVKIKGRGNSGRFSGPAGDLLVKLVENFDYNDIPIKYNKLPNPNLSMTINCSIYDILLSRPITINTPGGTTQVSFNSSLISQELPISVFGKEGEIKINTTPNPIFHIPSNVESEYLQKACDSQEF